MIPHPTGVLVFPREIEDILLPLPQCTEPWAARCGMERTHCLLVKDVTVIGKETPGEVAEKVHTVSLERNVRHET